MGAEKSVIHEKDRERAVSAKLSRVVFPEICPVCLSEAEDLVALTILETKDRWTENRSLVGGWIKAQDRAEIAIQESRGGATFWIPACLQHGSGSTTTPRKKTISAIGFLVLLYPFLFYMLGLTAALEFSRPLSEIVGPLLVILVIIIVDIMYGFYPRALERYVIIREISRAKDNVTIFLKNDEYRMLFLEQNALHAELYENMKTENNPNDTIGGKRNS